MSPRQRPHLNSTDFATACSLTLSCGGVVFGIIVNLAGGLFGVTARVFGFGLLTVSRMVDVIRRLHNLASNHSQCDAFRWLTSSLPTSGWEIRLPSPLRGDANQLVLFQVGPGALHLDILIRCKLRANAIIRSRTGVDVCAVARLKSSFQVLADQAIHDCPPPVSERVHGWQWM